MSRMEDNYRLLERTYHSKKDMHMELQEMLISMERTKNFIDTELNSLKPEIKQMQAERGKLYRRVHVRACVCEALKFS